MDIYNNREDALQFCNEIMDKMFMLLNEMDKVGDLPCLNNEELDSADDVTFGELWKELTRSIRALHEMLKAAVLIYMAIESDSTGSLKEVTNLLDNVSSVISEGREYSRDDVLDTLNTIKEYTKESMEDESNGEDT